MSRRINRADLNTSILKFVWALYVEYISRYLGVNIYAGPQTYIHTNITDITDIQTYTYVYIGLIR